MQTVSGRRVSNNVKGERQMNETVIKGKWHQTKGAVKEQWGRLTDDDVKMLLGEGEQLVGKLQERYGYTKEQAEQEVADFLDSLHEDLPFAQEREHAAEVVRKHPWFTGVFFGGIVLILAGYTLSRIFNIVEIEEEFREKTA